MHDDCFFFQGGSDVHRCIGKHQELVVDRDLEHGQMRDQPVGTKPPLAVEHSFHDLRGGHPAFHQDVGLPGADHAHRGFDHSFGILGFDDLHAFHRTAQVSGGLVDLVPPADQDGGNETHRRGFERSLQRMFIGRLAQDQTASVPLLTGKGKNIVDRFYHGVMVVFFVFLPFTAKDSFRHFSPLALPRNGQVGSGHICG